ncbi:MAG: hypothetical protein LBJ68_01035 [Endomicrobium sp.]|jgi:DNA polymerase-1|nr:hypothetical protein [Endomicrobium sp.]
MKKFFIIDGNMYIHRAYHALPHLFTSDNQQINAVYGFMKLLFKIKNNFNPDYISVCFDYPSKNFRHNMFKSYKANRKPLDDALIAQMLIARKATKALDILGIEVQGYEADDLIATLTQNSKKNNIQAVIVTRDKDIFQLIEDEKILVWNGKDVMYNKQYIEKKYEVEPKQLVDVFALMGDVTDNIPGVKGIGKKTAVKLIKEFGNLENVLKNVEFIKKKIGVLINEGKNEALLSKKLIELNRQVPLRYKMSEFENRNLDLNKVTLFLEKYGFRSLLDKYLTKNKFISAQQYLF